MDTLTFITGSDGKYAEASAIIPGLERKDLKLDEIQDLDPHVILVRKLWDASHQHRGAVVVEDVSLYLPAFGLKLPGPFIKWFLEDMGAQGIYERAVLLGNVEAEARCIVGYQSKDGANTQFFEGSIRGTVVAPRKGAGKAFGWDPIFQPDRHVKTFAEMSLAHKNAISHRAQAFRKLKRFLDALERPT
jgi:inosine triphosphate pyrophosphatase